MFCPNCGKELHNNVKFCAQCGKKIDNAPQSLISNSETIFFEPSASKRKSFKIKLSMKWIVIGIMALAIVAYAGYQVWLSINFPGVDRESLHFRDALMASSVSSILWVGDTFDQEDFAITPLNITYTSNKLYYDKYDEPYVSIILDITCNSGKWKPEYQDVIFRLDGSAAFNQPSFDSVEIKRGETVQYTFVHPLISTTTQDVDMQLSFKCKTGATVELHFLVNDIQEFFGNSNYGYPSGNAASTYQPSSDYSDTEAGWILRQYAGAYETFEGYGDYLFIGADESGRARAILYTEDLPEPVSIIIYNEGINEYGWGYVNGNDYELLGGSMPHYDMTLGFYGADPNVLTVNLYDVSTGEEIMFVLYKTDPSTVPYPNPYY